MTICDGTCTPQCYGCRLRAKNVCVAPSAMPSRMNSIPPPTAKPVWERGVVTDKRPDGSEMPVFSPGTREPLRVHEYSEKRRFVEERRRLLKTSERPLPG